MAHGDTRPVRWLIGVELARYRDAAGLSLAQVSEQSGISRAKLNHLESGRQMQDSKDIANLLAVYGVPEYEAERLISLTKRMGEAAWWQSWAAVSPEWLHTYLALEGLSEAMFHYEPTVIPGIVQTREYAYAVSSDATRVRKDHLERFVNLRLARYERIMCSEQPTRLHVVTTEAALRLNVGSEEVRRGQLEHLLRISEETNCVIQVTTPECGIHSGCVGSFVVLELAPEWSIAYSELHDDAVYVHHPDKVLMYILAKEDLQQVALSPADSAEFIQGMLKEGV